MKAMLLFWMVSIALPVSASSGLPGPAQASAMPGRTSGYKIVLVAGDGSVPVFDNAVEAVRARLRSSVGSEADIQRLSAIETAAASSATLAHVLTAIATMRPKAGQGCLVFATSHGARRQGLWLSAAREHLTPEALDAALQQGCGTAQTVVVISGCYSGDFARPPMARANRIVLTAARADRTSFGCGAGRTYTVFDKCLLDALDAGGTWRRAYSGITECVGREERAEQVAASEPQAWFGADVSTLLMARP